MNTKKITKGPNKESNEFDTKQSSTQNQGIIQSNANKDAQRKGSNAAALFRRQSKLIGQQDDLAIRIMQKYGIERVDLEMINFNFKKYDSTDSGKIQFHQLLSILKNMQFSIDDGVKKAIFKELEDRGIKSIELETVFLIVGVLRQKEQKLMEEGDDDYQSEFIDAFVALGGNPDSTGRVMKTAMLKIIKEEFDLTFDMEKIMERIEASSEELDYQTFCALFENQDDDRKRRGSRASTMLSQFSARSRKSINSIPSVKIKYQDFEKFCQEFSD
ncbi:hypothetical protein ABPG72_012414 [Tetrahymena utriculariae]